MNMGKMQFQKKQTLLFLIVEVMWNKNAEVIHRLWEV